MFTEVVCNNCRIFCWYPLILAFVSGTSTILPAKTRLLLIFWTCGRRETDKTRPYESWSVQSNPWTNTTWLTSSKPNWARESSNEILRNSLYVTVWNYDKSAVNDLIDDIIDLSPQLDTPVVTIENSKKLFVLEIFNMVENLIRNTNANVYINFCLIIIKFFSLSNFV